MSEKAKAVNDNAGAKTQVVITHTVVKGDTIYSIAEKHLGKTSRASEIRRANNLVTDILRVGKVLTIPKK